jgi:hypothetical protein
MSGSIQILLITAAATLGVDNHPHSVRTAQDAIVTALKSVPGKQDPNSWYAEYDRASRTWEVCQRQQNGSRRTGFCAGVDGRTGRFLGLEIVN